MTAQGKDFDWVTARNDCTARSAFSELRDAVISDIKARIGQVPELDRQLEFHDKDTDTFSVAKPGSHMIVFARVGETIAVSRRPISGATEDLATVAVGMNDEGECTLKQGDAELTSWQFRRIALEETLFG